MRCSANIKINERPVVLILTVAIAFISILPGWSLTILDSPERTLSTQVTDKLEENSKADPRLGEGHNLGDFYKNLTFNTYPDNPYGAASNGEHIFRTGWENIMYKYESDTGMYLGTEKIPFKAASMDLCWDGNHWWGANFHDGLVTKWSPGSEVPLATYRWNDYPIATGVLFNPIRSEIWCLFSKNVNPSSQDAAVRLDLEGNLLGQVDAALPNTVRGWDWLPREPGGDYDGRVIFGSGNVRKVTGTTIGSQDLAVLTPPITDPYRYASPIRHGAHIYMTANNGGNPESGQAKLYHTGPIIIDRVPKLKELQVIGLDPGSNTCLAMYKTYILKAHVVAFEDLYEMSKFTLRLDYNLSDIILIFDPITKTFSKEGDPNDQILLLNTSIQTNDSVSKWWVEFHMMFNFSFPHQFDVDCLGSVTSNYDVSSKTHFSRVFRVGKDLELYGEPALEVEGMGTVQNNTWIPGSSNLTFSDIRVNYHGFPSAFPSGEYFRIKVEDTASNQWTHDPKNVNDISLTAFSKNETDENEEYAIALTDLPQGCTGKNSLNFPVKIDADKPTGGILINGGATTAGNTELTLNVHASDMGSGLDKMQTVDENGADGNWMDFSQATTLIISDEPGLKTIGVRFRDNAGLVSDLFTDSIYYGQVEQNKLKVSSTTHPDQDRYYNNATPVFEWEIPTDPGAISGYSYLIDKFPTTSPDLIPEITNGGVNWTYKGEFSGLEDGTHFFHIIWVDTFNNTAEPSHFKFNIDRAAPVFSDPSPGREEWSITEMIECSIIISEQGSAGLDLKRLEYCTSRDGIYYGAWTTMDLEYETLAVDQMSEVVLQIRAKLNTSFSEGGSTVIRFTILDLAGNRVISPPIIELRVDTTPVKFLNQSPEPEDKMMMGEVNCSITVSDTGGSGVLTSSIQYSISTGGPSISAFGDWLDAGSTGSGSNITSLIIIELPPGKDNYIRWRAKDWAGNGFTVSKPYQVWVNSPPVVEILSPKDSSSFVSGESISITGQAQDIDGGELKYYWTADSGNGTETIGFTLNTTKTFTRPGFYSLKLSVTDDYNVQTSKGINITIKDNSKNSVKEKGGALSDLWWLWIMIVMAIIAAIIVAVIIIRKKEGRGQDLSSDAIDAEIIGRTGVGIGMEDLDLVSQSSRAEFPPRPPIHTPPPVHQAHPAMGTSPKYQHREFNRPPPPPQYSTPNFGNTKALPESPSTAPKPRPPWPKMQPIEPLPQNTNITIPES